MRTYISLKGAEEVAEEWVGAAEREDLPLDHRALDVVVLEHDVLPEGLDGVVGLGGPVLGQEDLAEAENEASIIIYTCGFLKILILKNTHQN